MEVRLVSMGREVREALAPDRIVSVRVLSREDDGITVLVNGQKLKARMETDPPGYFLAYVEEGPGGRINLRLLDSVRSDAAFQAKQAGQMLDNARMWLLENNLPAGPENLEAAYRLFKSGIKWTVKNLRLAVLFQALPDALSSRLFNAMAAGAAMDTDTPALLKDLDTLLRLFSEAGDRKLLNGEEVLPGESGNSLEDLLSALFNSGEMVLLGKEKAPDGDWIYKFRKEKVHGIKRYIFELGSMSGGTATLSAEMVNTGWKLELYLDEILHDKIKDPENVQKSLSDQITKLIKPSAARLFLRRREDPFLFWASPVITENGDNGIRGKVDISV